jgi:osmotically-inducible protein OsmY
MNARNSTISFRKLLLINCAFLGSTAFGSVGLAERAAAQDVDTPAFSQTAAVTLPSTQTADSISDEKLEKRVKGALHSDPYFYDRHVEVAVENGDVVLRGFVASEWDVRDAYLIANKAAGHRLVINELSIKMGGR